jgi:hypothetical protein
VREISESVWVSRKPRAVDGLWTGSGRVFCVEPAGTNSKIEGGCFLFTMSGILVVEVVIKLLGSESSNGSYNIQVTDLLSTWQLSITVYKI